MITTATTTQPAEAKCCGAQLAWNSQLSGHGCWESVRERKPPGRASPRIGRNEAPRPSNRTRAEAMRRPPIAAARPIIRVSDAKAVNQVSAISASHPLVRHNAAGMAALKCQR